jgi:hypothetical protein
MQQSSLLAHQGTGFTLTEHGLRITRQLDWDEWRGLLSQARCIKKTYLSVLSDITDYGRRTFGDPPVNEALEQLEFEMSDATKAHVIAMIGYDRRVKFDLTSEHAYVLGSLLETTAARDKWAALCLQHTLTAFELKKSIEKGEVIRESEIREASGHGDGIPSVQAIRFQFEKWQRQFADRNAILKLPKAERRKILELLAPIVELAGCLQTSFTPPLHPN